MNPTFSVVVPTLNRPELARNAIDSLIYQNCDCCVEIILSNNGSNKRTAEIFNGQLYKGKIKYIETSEVLSMTEHWEWASSYATGQYLMILPDRRILKQGAISLLNNAINSYPESEAIVFCDEWLYRSGRTVSMQSQKNDSFMSTIQIITDFEKGHFDRNILPLGLNSVIKHDFIMKYREKHGFYFQPISPDFRSAFNFLFAANNLFSIADPIMITTAFDLSNGGAAYNGDPTYFCTLKDDGIFKFMPRCLEGNVWASIYEDYLRAKSTLSCKVHYEEIMSIEAMYKIFKEELTKVIICKFSKYSLSRFFIIRKLLKVHGWKMSNDLKSLRSISILYYLIPISLKNMYRNISKIIYRRTDVLSVAGF